MVTFTCQNCNSSLKKKVVETHLYKCKNPQLTCIDCLKDFDSKSYATHITCVTEDERYGGHGYTPTTGMHKQTLWYQSIFKVLKTAKLDLPALKNILQYASEFSTCPRNKKKFINFILNYKQFSSARSLAEKAYDLINEEFNKSQENENTQKKSESVNGDKDESALSKGKRKKISETELQEESVTNGVHEQMSDNTSRKKNRNVSEISVDDKKIENGEVGHKKGKKKNKQNIMSENNEVTQNGDETTEDSVQNKKKKKNKDKQKKNKVNKENEENDVVEVNGHTNSLNNEETEQNEVDNEDSIKVEPAEENLEKLTKKERKKLMKMKRYNAEIKSIENYKKPGDDEEVCIGDSVSDPSVEGEKRRKKKKTIHIEEEIREQKSSISEPDDKKIRLEDGDRKEIEPVIEKPKKFKWDSVIVEVLQSQGDGEMSLKRLSKKVCSEYAAILGEPKSWEDVLLKFNKKVLRTPGVRVFKDKAKLITEL